MYSTYIRELLALGLPSLCRSVWESRGSGMEHKPCRRRFPLVQAFKAQGTRAVFVPKLHTVHFRCSLTYLYILRIYSVRYHVHNTLIRGLKLRVALQLDQNKTKFQQLESFRPALCHMPRVSMERNSGRTICSTENKNKDQHICTTSHEVCNL